MDLRTRVCGLRAEGGQPFTNSEARTHSSHRTCPLGSERLKERAVSQASGRTPGAIPAGVPSGVIPAGGARSPTLEPALSCRGAERLSSCPPL